uniref:DROUGHT SENSITIVE 1 n=1 Tax=Zea mays TaxID=4577 RepID=A0A804LQA6_MAIZE
MASPPPGAGLTEYERRREENIRRNETILAALRRKAAELSASFIPTASSPKRPKKQHPLARTTSPVVLRRSLRTRGIPAGESSACDGANTSLNTPPSPTKPRSTRELVLRPVDVRKVVPGRILSLRILPLSDRTVVVAGNVHGHIGFWDVDRLVEDEDGDGVDGVFEYFPHRGSVGGIVMHPAMLHKIYSSSYHGEICLMDVEKENFNTVYLCDYPIFSLCQAPNSPSSLYFAEGNELKLFDERMGKVPTTWSLHDHRINSIDFRPENPYIFATSSTDRTVCIWDIRRMKKKGSESLKVLEYNKSIQSAYFSPSGNMLATTSLDDTVRIFDIDNFDDSCTLKHDNRTGRWLSTFKYEFHALSHSLVSNPSLFSVMKLKSMLAGQSGAGMTAIYLLGA